MQCISILKNINIQLSFHIKIIKIERVNRSVYWFLIHIKILIISKSNTNDTIYSTILDVCYHYIFIINQYQYQFCIIQIIYFDYIVHNKCYCSINTITHQCATDDIQSNYLILTCINAITTKKTFLFHYYWHWCHNIIILFVCHLAVVQYQMRTHWQQPGANIQQASTRMPVIKKWLAEGCSD